MSEIKTQTVYICPETGKKCRSRAEAERSAAKAIKAREDAAIAVEQQKLAEKSNLQNKDWIRLNLTNIKDLPDLIKEKAKEFWNINCNIEINVTFGQVRNSHGAPLNKKTNWSGDNKNYPTSFPGWSGQIKGNVLNYKKGKNISESISSLLFNNYTGGRGFRGFHTSSGCPGDVEGNYPMDIGFYFFLEDFPRLAESYELFNTEYQKVIDHKEAVKMLNIKAEHYSNAQSDVIEIEKQIFELSCVLQKLRNEHEQKYIIDNPVKVPIIDSKLEDLKKIFKSYRGYGQYRNYDFDDEE